MEAMPCPAQACKDDLDALCSDAASAFDEFDYLRRSFANQMCLLGHQDAASPQCIDSLNHDHNIVATCYDDIISYCADVEPGESRVHQCLEVPPHSHLYLTSHNECVWDRITERSYRVSASTS